MVIPSYQDGKTDEYFNMNIEEDDDSMDTRKAGISLFDYKVWYYTILNLVFLGKTLATLIFLCLGGQAQKEKPLVIVDMREFRSDLPALLHKKGINIEPVTITVSNFYDI